MKKSKKKGRYFDGKFYLYLGTYDYKTVAREHAMRCKFDDKTFEKVGKARVVKAGKKWSVYFR